jgi:general secretion pathway protein G
MKTFASRRRRGFTLMEIILVMVIILTLVSIVGPKLAGKARAAKVNATKIQIANLKTALQNFEIHASRFPTTSEGLDALVKKPSDLSDEEWPDKYMDEVPMDSWGKPFEYKFPSDHGKEYDLISAGPDKQIGTADDITNFMEKPAPTGGL